ncbi:unnamed protein product [Amoebophrya sp. A120]|nr:unnamed protein product [Amoebophrya sp. A120]|eukprot:GSA120T00007068001.1
MKQAEERVRFFLYEALLQIFLENGPSIFGEVKVKTSRNNSKSEEDPLHGTSRGGRNPSSSSSFAITSNQFLAKLVAEAQKLDAVLGTLVNAVTEAKKKLLAGTNIKQQQQQKSFLKTTSGRQVSSQGPPGTNNLHSGSVAVLPTKADPYAPAYIQIGAASTTIPPGAQQHNSSPLQKDQSNPDSHLDETESSNIQELEKQTSLFLLRARKLQEQIVHELQKRILLIPQGSLYQNTAVALDVDLDFKLYIRDNFCISYLHKQILEKMQNNSQLFRVPPQTPQQINHMSISSVEVLLSSSARPDDLRHEVRSADNTAATPFSSPQPVRIDLVLQSLQEVNVPSSSSAPSSSLSAGVPGGGHHLGAGATSGTIATAFAQPPLSTTVPDYVLLEEQRRVSLDGSRRSTGEAREVDSSALGLDVEDQSGLEQGSSSSVVRDGFFGTTSFFMPAWWSSGPKGRTPARRWGTAAGASIVPTTVLEEIFGAACWMI